MILAVGLYERFIGAVASVTRLKLDASTIRFLTFLAVGLVVAVVGLSAPAVWLVTEHRWLAYSLFIGMTLGGVPSLTPIVRPFDGKTIVSVLAGVSVMAALAWGLSNTVLAHNPVVFLLIGAVAASSMILPGISGSYILLIFGLYDVVIGSLRPSALMEDPSGSLTILVPVCVGAVLGIGLLSNFLKFFLARYERPAHGVLLGLLLGSVLGLFPFQKAEHPELVSKAGSKAIAALVAGGELNAVNDEFGTEYSAAEAGALKLRYAGQTRGDLKLLGLRLERYAPSPLQGGLALVVLVAGFGVTRLIGGRK